MDASNSGLDGGDPEGLFLAARSLLAILPAFI